MDSFDAYSPGKWLSDGILRAAPATENYRRRVREKAYKFLVGAGLVLSASSMTIGASATPLSIPQFETVNDIAAFKVPSSAKIDPEVVPDGYWDRVVAAIRDAPKDLSDQNNELDPPPLFD